jgi:hypothetical protein
MPEREVARPELAGTVPLDGNRSRAEGDSRAVEARKRDGHLATIVAARRLTFLNCSVEISNKRDAAQLLAVP